MSETQTPTNEWKRRKVAAPTSSVLGKETLPMAADKKRLWMESTTQEYLPALAGKQLPNLHENADLWAAETVKARKAAFEVIKAFNSQIDLSCFDKGDFVEISDMLMLNAAQMAACAQSLREKCSNDSALSAESLAKISKLTQDLEEAQSEIKLGKINQEIAEKLVEQAKQEKHIVELKFTGEKACLKKKIQELETELQQQKERFKDALLHAEAAGYNKCVKKAKEKGLKYAANLLLNPVYDPIGNQQEESLVHPSAENSRDLDNVPEHRKRSLASSRRGRLSSTTVPIGTDSTATIPIVSSKEKALFDQVDPIFYNSIIEELAKKNLEAQVGGVVSKKGENGTLMSTLSSLNISETCKQMKECKTELARMEAAAFILGYNKCAENIGEGNVYVPSRHNLQSFVAWESASLENLKYSSGNAELKW